MSVKALSPFLWLAALWLGTEALVSQLSPYTAQAPAREATRITYDTRGWPEYIRGDKQSGERLVVLISNSQGLAEEFADSDLLYTQRMRDLARHAGLALNIENWAISGIRTDQIELLSMQAARRGADLVLLVLAPTNIDRLSDRRFGFHAADLHLMVGHPAIWPLLRDAAFIDAITYDDILLRSVFLASPVVRSRDRVLDRIAARLDSATQRLSFGHVRSRQAATPLAERPGAMLQDEEPAQTAPATRRPLGTREPWERQFMDERLPVFRAFFPPLHQRLTDAGARLVWIWMPTTGSRFRESLWAAADPFHERICTEIREHGATCIDATGVLPPDHFLHDDPISHLNSQGHAAMADYLLAVILDVLH